MGFCLRASVHSAYSYVNFTPVCPSETQSCSSQPHVAHYANVSNVVLWRSRSYGLISTNSLWALRMSIGNRGSSVICLKQSRFVKRNCSCGVHSSLVPSARSAVSPPGGPHSLTDSLLRVFSRRKYASFSFLNLQPRLIANRKEINAVLPFVNGMFAYCFRTLGAPFRYGQP